MSDAPTVVATSEPINPSQVFLGLMCGAKGWRPNRTPEMYAKVSLQATKTTKVRIRAGPSSEWPSNTINPARKGM